MTDSSAADRSSIWLWKALRVVLAIGAGGAFLVGSVFLVLGMAVVAEGKFSQLTLALAAGFVSFVFAWLLGKGVRAVRKRENDLAIAEYTKVIREQATPVGHHNHGLACHGKGDYARAIAHFEEAIRLDPGIADAHVGRVNAYGAIGQYDRLIAEYTEAIRLGPTDSPAYCARATAYNGLGQYERAIPDATEAIRLAPHHYLGHDARGWGFLGRGNILALKRLGFTTTGSRADYQQAVADFTEAIRLMPTAWDCYQGRARAYRALGERVKAAGDEARVRELQGR